MAKELQTGHNKYTVFDNKKGVHYLYAKDDEEALEIMKKIYGIYIVSILSRDSIVLVRPNNKILAYIDTATGYQTVRTMDYWLQI